MGSNPTPSAKMKIIKSVASNDGKTIKYLQKANDNHIIETGYYNLDEHIICISSQVGCLMGCIFCAAGSPEDTSAPQKRFIRNLTSDEIVDQVKNVLEIIDKKEIAGKKILFSYMGMGEAFLNYENVIDSIKILSKIFPNSRTTISTIGVRPDLMKKLAGEKIDTVLKLHLSLHAPSDDLRKKILPNAKNIKPALDALKYFFETRKTSVKVNYVLIQGLNDSNSHAIQLAKLIKPFPFTVKLSKLNEFNNLKPSGDDRLKVFEEILNSYGIKTCRYSGNGSDIEANCGQLRRHFYDN